jgi:hypothetical protein
VLAYGRDAVVLEPPELIADLRTQAQGLAASYAAAPPARRTSPRPAPGTLARGRRDS